MGNGVKFLGFAGLALVVLQIFPVDRSNPPVNGPLEIGDAEVAGIMERACVDCHTNHTEWPWYSRVAPVSWWIVDHVEHGRSHMNLSEWGTMSADDQDHALEEMAEMVESGEMPMPSYIRGHSEADLTAQERETLIRWAEAQRAAMAGGS